MINCKSKPNYNIKCYLSARGNKQSIYDKFFTLVLGLFTGIVKRDRIAVVKGGKVYGRNY
jgi:hypothetical protein